MKHLKFLFLFIGLAILASCSDTDVNGGLIADENQANFSGKIGELQTRVTDNSWENGDAIGIYALNAGAELSEVAIFDGKSNVKYTTDAEGNFTAAAAPINFPNDGDLDFVAYYPYTSPITDYKYSIDVTTQSDLAAIDLLYSDNAKGANKSAPNVALKFNHMLSKLMLNIQLGENLTSLAGLTASINDVIVDGELALVDGTVTPGDTRNDITPNVAIASGNETAVVTAIVVPNQNLEDVTITFSLAGKDYSWTPTTQELESTYKYAYTLKLTTDESGPIVVPVKVGATINDWNDPNIGDTPIVLDPEKEGEDPVAPGEGDGSKENPYTVAQAFANQGAPKNTDYVWVRGYIVGYKNNSGYDVEFSVDDASGTNIVIADSKDETDGAKALGVQLASNSDARKDLNLLDNSGMYKAEVLLYGTLEKYFSDDEGLKNVSEYELVTPGEGGNTPTPVEFTTDKSTVALNADTELTSTVKLTTDAAQAWTVASDASWLTVAPASGSGNADIVLTATENTAETSRTATVTFSPTANTDLTPIVVTVTQSGSAPLPVSNLLFPGSDFNNWAVFTNSLNSFGLKDYAKESAAGGRDGSGAMHIEGTPTGNDYVFTAVIPEGFSATGKTMIHFWVKGTAAKSLSLNVYTGSTYSKFNLGDATADVVLEPVGSNQYVGTIDTGGEWIKVSLNISTIANDISSTVGENLFALKVGREVSYDLLVDDITIE